MKKETDLLNLINLDKQKQLINPKFQAVVEKAKTDIVLFWKEKYGYSSNDPRYYTATKIQIYQDVVDFLALDYIRDVGSDPIREEAEKGRLADPHYDLKQAEELKRSLMNIEIVNLGENE